MTTLISREKLSKNCWMKNSWKCCGFKLFSCWQLWFHEKNCPKIVGWKTREDFGVLSKLNFWTKIWCFELSYLHGFLSNTTVLRMKSNSFILAIGMSMILVGGPRRKTCSPPPSRFKKKFKLFMCKIDSKSTAWMLKTFKTSKEDENWQVFPSKRNNFLKGKVAWPLEFSRNIFRRLLDFNWQ